MAGKKQAKSTQVQGKPNKEVSVADPCPWLCNLVPDNVPRPGSAQSVLHPRKDVFVLKEMVNLGTLLISASVSASADIKLKISASASADIEKTYISNNPGIHISMSVAKVGANGDRRCKMELELVTPKGPEKKPLNRIDTRETQCDPECTCCKKRS